MDTGKKLMEIQRRLGLTEKNFALVVGVSHKLVKKWINGDSDPDPEELARIAEVFNIDVTSLTDSDTCIPLLTMKKKINVKKYKNPFAIYTEVLKEYYNKPWKIYVLAKFKQKNKIQGYLDLFFNNSKKVVINKMNNFSPSYLVEKGDTRLLVCIHDSHLEVSELQIGADEKRFVFKNYRYVKANEIKLQN